MPLRLLTLDESRYALQLSAVERVLQLVEIVPLHGAPPIVSGVIDMRRRFGPAERPATLSDQLVVAPTPQPGRVSGRRALQRHTDRIS
jgi:purine-binding chemotaxis protein CheW